MSAIRGYPRGTSHCTGKGALDRYANALMLELYKKRIFVTTIRPGAIDTGMYDSEEVQEAIQDISLQYNGAWTEKITFAPPSAVGEAILYSFAARAHIPSINIVAQMQFPNEGS